MTLPLRSAGLLALAAFSLAALGGAGCAGAQEATPPVSEATAESDSLRLAVGESAVRGGQTVEFQRLVEDSRCPPETQCVWAGRVQVRVAVGGEPVVLTLPARADETDAVERGGTRVELVGLEGGADAPRVVLVARSSGG